MRDSMQELLRYRLITLVGLLAVAVAILITSLGFTFASRMLPLVASAVAIPVALLAIVRSAMLLRRQAVAVVDDEASPAEQTPVTPATRVFPADGLRYVAWMAGLATAVGVIGGTIAVPAFLLTFVRFEGKYPWRLSIILAVIGGLCVAALDRTRFIAVPSGFF